MEEMVAKTAFMEAFGDSPKIKVIDYALDNYIFDFSKSDVAEGTGVSRTTINKFFGELVKQKILVKTRKIGRATLHKLNAALPFVRKLIELDDLLTKNAFEKEFGKGKANKNIMKSRAEKMKIIEAVA